MFLLPNRTRRCPLKIATMTILKDFHRVLFSWCLLIVGCVAAHFPVEKFLGNSRMFDVRQGDAANPKSRPSKKQVNNRMWVTGNR